MGATGFQWSLRLKLVLAAVLIEAVVLALMLANSVRLFDGFIAQQAEQRVSTAGRVLAAAVAPELARADPASLGRLLESLVRDDNNHLAYVVVDRGARRYAAAGARHLADADRRDVEAAHVMRASTPLRYSGGVIGELRYGVTFEALYGARDSLVIEGVAIALGGLLLGTLVLALAGYWLTRPLAGLVRGVEAITAGDYHATVTVGSHDEVGQLAEQFNRMGAAVREHLAALRRANRALLTLSHCGEALARIADEQALLDEVCRILLRDGGYRLAWVGYADDPIDKRVRPMAYAGYEDGYLETLGITWADSERGRGPTGTAIREHRPVIVRNIHTDPAFAPWRADAERRGYASSIALPVAIGGLQRAALNIYAAEPDAFDAREVELLMKLADDLAYGISALRTANALRDSERKYRELLDQASDGIFVSDAAGHYLEVNAAATRMTGYSRAELLDMNLRDLIEPDELSRDPPHLDELHSGWAMVRQRNLRRKDGSVFPAEISAKVLANGWLQGIARDITERRRIEAALRTERDFNSAVLDTVGSLVVVLERRGHIVRFNRACEQMTGYAFAEVEDRPIWDLLLPPEQVDAVRGVFAALTARQFPNRYENEWLTRSGGRRLIAWSNTALTDSSGEVVYVIATGNDVTELRRNEVERERMMEELTARNAEMENFVYTISHDLKTPLITITGFTGLLAKDMERGDRVNAEDSLAEIRKAGVEMLHLIDDLLELSRSGRIIGERQPVSLGTLFGDAVAQLRERIAAAGARVEFGADLAGLNVDRRRMQQVLTNLIDNAIKYRHRDRPPAVEVGGEWRDGEARIHVRDNGRGIRPEYLKRLFGLFERFDTDVEGTGVGLAIARRIVEVHGGSMWVESVPDAGSTFWIALPATLATTTAAAVAPPRETQS